MIRASTNILKAFGTMPPLVPPGCDLDGALAEAANGNRHGEWLIRKWCRGKLSAEEVLDGAKSATRSGDSGDELLDRLARLNPHNAHRDILRALKPRCKVKFPPEYWAQIPLWDESRQRSVDTWVPFNLPHEWLDALADTHDNWVDYTPEMQGQIDDFMTRTSCPKEGPPLAAISVWGDTAPYHTGHDSIMLLLWSCLSASVAKRWWITVLSKASLCQCDCNGRHTLDAIWRIVGWSLSKLLSGIYPDRDHNNNEFTSDWRRDRATNPLKLRGACLQFRGDWPWLSYVFGLAYHSSKSACFLCRGLMDMSCPLTAASSDAKWRRRLVTTTDWMTQRFSDADYISGVFSWPGFAFQYIVLDWMHMVDLGIAQNCLGNILFELFREMGGLITNPAPTLARLLTLLDDASNDLGIPCPFSKLTLSMIRGENKQPNFKAKAAKTRHMVPIVLGMLVSHFPPTNDREYRRLRCLEYLNLAYCELNNWRADSATRLENYCRRHVLLFLSLSREAIAESGSENWVNWRWKPKHHMVLHLSGEQARRMGSPRTWWCYSDEGAIGNAVDIAEAVHIRTLPSAALAKNLVWETLNLST